MGPAMYAGRPSARHAAKMSKGECLGRELGACAAESVRAVWAGASHFAAFMAVKLCVAKVYCEPQRRWF